MEWFGLGALFLQPKQNKRTSTIAKFSPLPYWAQSQQSNKVVKGFRVMLYRRNGENVDKALAVAS
jgi:hypothetical protein